jgi:hypothetical protein
MEGFRRSSETFEIHKWNHSLKIIEKFQHITKKNIVQIAQQIFREGLIEGDYISVDYKKLYLIRILIIIINHQKKIEIIIK